MLMGSTDFYSEQLLDEARDDGTDQDIWMSIVYEDIPLAYIRMSEDEMDFFRDETGIESYSEFWKKLIDNRDELPERIGGLDSYDIVEQAFEVNPGVLYKFAGEDFERDIDREIMDRFNKHDKKSITGDIGDDFDMLFEGMDEIVQDVVAGRLEEFKGSMYHRPIFQNSLVVYEESLGKLYSTVNQLQREHKR